MNGSYEIYTQFCIAIYTMDDFEQKEITTGILCYSVSISDTTNTA